MCDIVIPEQHYINQAYYLNNTYIQQDFKCSTSISSLACTFPILNCFNQIDQHILWVDDVWPLLAILK